MENLQERIKELQERYEGYQPMIQALHEAKDRVYDKLTSLKIEYRSKLCNELLISTGLFLNNRYEVDTATYTHITIIDYTTIHNCREGYPTSIQFRITGKSRETKRWRNDKNLWTPEQLKGIILL